MSGSCGGLKEGPQGARPGSVTPFLSLRRRGTITNPLLLLWLKCFSNTQPQTRCCHCSEVTQRTGSDRFLGKRLQGCGCRAKGQQGLFGSSSHPASVSLKKRSKLKPRVCCMIDGSNIGCLCCCPDIKSADTDLVSHGYLTLAL